MLAKGDDVAVLAARKLQNQSKTNNVRCDHCHKSGHTKDSCFELTGYLEWSPERNSKTGQSKTKRPAQTGDRARQTNRGTNSTAAQVTGIDQSTIAQLVQAFSQFLLHAQLTGNGGNAAVNAAISGGGVKPPSAGKEEEDPFGSWAGCPKQMQAWACSESAKELNSWACAQKPNISKTDGLLNFG